jgi:ABC transporter, permease protein
VAKEKLEKAPKQPKAPKEPKVKKPREKSQAQLEKEFNKERAKRLKEREKKYRAAKKAGTLDPRQMTPEHLRYLRRKRIIERVWPIFRFFILFGLCFVILYPLIYMLSTAFRPSAQMTDPSVIWLPKSFTLNNIKDVWGIMDFGPTLLNTVLLNLVCSLLSVVVCAVTGYGFARFNFKGKGILFAIVLMQIIVPPQITVIPLYLQWAFFKCAGLVKMVASAGASTFLGINIKWSDDHTQAYISLIDHSIVMYAPAIFANGIKSGLYILIFRQFFKGLPKELEDAAYLDGCGPFKTFIRIMVPNAASSFLTVFLFAIVWYWNDYYVSSTFFINNHTVALALQKLSSTLDAQLFNNAQVGTRKKIVWLESGCLLTIAPILVMYCFLQKHFTEGLERSGLVG